MKFSLDRSTLLGRLIWQPLDVWGLSLLAIAAPPLAVFSFTSLPAAVMLASFYWLRPSVWSAALRRWGRTPPLIVLLGLAAWAGVSILWSPDKADAAGTLLRVIVLVSAGLVMATGTEGARWDIRRVEIPIIAAFGALFLILGVEALTGGELYRLAAGYAPSAAPGLIFNPDGGLVPRSELMMEVGSSTVFLATLIWPVSQLVAERWRAPWLALLAVGATGALLFFHAMIAAQFAFALSGAVFALVWLGGRRAAAVVVAIAMVFVAVAPWASKYSMNAVEGSHVYSTLPISAQQRVHIYRYAAEKALEAPIAGHGFAASKTLSQTAPRVDLGVGFESVGVLPVHPHDVALQVWLELGVVGAALTIAFVGLLGARMLSSPGAALRRILAMRLAVFVALATFASVSFGAWRYNWLGALLIVLIASLALDKALRARFAAADGA